MHSVILGPYLQVDSVSELIEYIYIHFKITNLSHILQDLAKILIKTGVLKLSCYFLQINSFKYIYFDILILTFLFRAECNW